MSDKCKLCTQRVKGNAAQALSGERSELLQCLFERFEIKYEAESKMCPSCFKNLKAMDFVLNRWQEAQTKARNTATDQAKVIANEAEKDNAVSTEEERPLTRTLLKKRAVTIAHELDTKPPKASIKNTLNNSTKLRAATTEKKPSPLKSNKTEINQSLGLISDATKNVDHFVVEIDSDGDGTNKTKRKKNDTLAKPKVGFNKEESSKRAETNKIQAENDGESGYNKEPSDTTSATETKRLKLKVNTNKKRTKRTETKIQTIAYMNEAGDVEYTEENKESPDREHIERKRCKMNPDYEPEVIRTSPTDNEEEIVSKTAKKANESNTSKVMYVNDMTLIAVTRGAQGGKLAQLYEDNSVEREEETTQWCALCANCREVFSCMRDLTKHLKTHQKPYFECEECLESYESLNELQEHQQSANHVGVSTANDEDKKMMFFECAHCEKIFLEHYNMVRHYREVHVASSDRYKCSQCGSCFKYKISLQEHLAKHLNLNLNTITCTQCDKTFKNNYQLNRHMLIHTGEQPHQCEQCQKRFRHRANLIVHLRTHTGELPFTCNNCNKGFSTSTHMRRHYESCLKRWLKKENKNSRTMVTLKEEELQFNPQKSTNSEVVFTLNTQKIINDNQDDSLLKRNFAQRQKPEQQQLKSPIKREIIEEQPKIIKVYSHEKRQLTDQNKKVKNATSLLKLSSQQTEAQPHVYKCKYCNKGYTQRSGLERHIRTHTGEKPYRCTQCNLTFADPSNFKRHRLSHKRPDDPTDENIDIEISTMASDSLAGTDDEGAATDPDPDANDQQQRSHGNFRIVSLNEM